jgi:hypothetical protein
MRPVWFCLVFLVVVAAPMVSGLRPTTVAAQDKPHFLNQQLDTVWLAE